MPVPDKPDLQLLTQVGFLAAVRGDLRRALRIFEALALLRPERAFPFVGLVTAFMHSGRASEAVARLQAVCLPAGPESDMLEAFRGLALQLAGRQSESTYVLRQVVMGARHAAPSEGALFASRLLGENIAAAPRPALSASAI